MVGNSRRGCGFQPNRHGNAPMGEDGIRPSANHADAGCLGTWDKATVVCLCTWTSLSHCTAASRDLPTRLRYKEHTVHTRVLGACPRVLETCISSYPLSISRPARSPRPRPRDHGYHTSPAGLNDNNNGILLTSGQTVVALTHVIVDPPSRSSESARVCVAVVESKSRQK
jgi:hypothetical protein